MKRLSGWMRLWIVGSVLWWVIAGATTGMGLYAGQPRIRTPEHRECIAEKVPYQASSRWEAWALCDAEYLRSSLHEMDERNLREEQRAYVVPMILGPLAVTVAPFIFWFVAAAVVKVVYWVWRGFKPIEA